MGLLWDISWHMTVSRGTFWTAPPPRPSAWRPVSPAAMWCCARLSREPRRSGRRPCFWGFRAPLGAWITIWGTFAMLVSAPFDDWWHNAYGLDVKIISPPHMLLFWGMLGILVGAPLASQRQPLSLSLYLSLSHTHTHTHLLTACRLPQNGRRAQPTGGATHGSMRVHGRRSSAPDLLRVRSARDRLVAQHAAQPALLRSVGWCLPAVARGVFARGQAEVPCDRQPHSYSC